MQKSSSVIRRYFHRFGKRKVFSGQIRDLFIDLHTFYVLVAKIFFTLHSICSCSHAKDQHTGILSFFTAHHQRCCHCIIIIHACQCILLHIYGLHTKQHIGRQYNPFIRFRYLQVIIDGFTFIGQILLPEGKGIRIAQNTT